MPGMATPAAAAAAASAVGGIAAWGGMPAGPCCAGSCSQAEAHTRRRHSSEHGASLWCIPAWACCAHVVCGACVGEAAWAGWTLTSRSCCCVFEAPPNSWSTKAPIALEGPAPASPALHMSEPVTRVRRDPMPATAAASAGVVAAQMPCCPGSRGDKSNEVNQTIAIHGCFLMGHTECC